MQDCTLINSAERLRGKTSTNQTKVEEFLHRHFKRDLSYAKEFTLECIQTPVRELKRLPITQDANTLKYVIAKNVRMYHED